MSQLFRLLDLPTELVLNIASYLPFWDLYALALTSRRFRNIIGSIKMPEHPIRFLFWDGSLPHRRYLNQNEIGAMENSTWCRDHDLLICEYCPDFHPKECFSGIYLEPRMGEAWMKVEWNKWLRRKCDPCVDWRSTARPVKDRFWCRRCDQFLEIDKFNPGLTDNFDKVWCTACWKKSDE